MDFTGSASGCLFALVLFCRGGVFARPNIVPQFLTLLLLLFIYFVVFLSQLFDRKKLQKLPAHGLSKSLPFFARATSCEHSVERRLSLVSAVPISGTKELASRTTNIAWRTRSDTFVLFPLLELTLAVAQHHAGFLGNYTCMREPKGQEHRVCPMKTVQNTQLFCLPICYRIKKRWNRAHYIPFAVTSQV